MQKNSELKIAIVHDFLIKFGGAERVLLALHEMFPEAPIYTLLYKKSSPELKPFTDCEIIPSNLNRFFLKTGKHKHLLPYLPKAIEEFDFSEYDIVISSSNSFAHGVITKPKTFHLSYCHSPMRYAWDYSHQYLVENNLKGLKGVVVRKIMHDIRIWDFVSSKRVDKWVANSSNVANRISKYYRQNSEVLHPPVEVGSIECGEDLPDDYFVIVSRLEPYKNVELAVKAFNLSKKPLVVIGKGSLSNKLKQIAKSNIEFLGWQSDASVYEYMKNAKALIFPSDDDIGITPIESLAAGRPVVAYNKGGVREVIEDGKTGILFQDATVESLNDAVSDLEENYMQFSPHVCRDKSEKFSKAVFEKRFKDILSQGYQEHLKSYE